MRIMNIIERLFYKPSAKDITNPNESVQRGCWGEKMAISHLIGKGWRIIERNARPCRYDKRCELDIVAYIPTEEQVVFVEVKTHRRHSSYASRLWAVDRRKRANLLRASASWLKMRKWHGNCRFDVIEIYGEQGSDAPIEIDHIMNVKLFPPNWRFW